MSANNQFSLVFLGRFPGKDRAVAQALAQAFGRDDSWGLQLVGASPIHVLNGLSASQAQTVYEALVQVEKVGCRFKIIEGLDPAYPSVNQPDDVKIYGRTVASMGGPRLRSSTSQQAITVGEMLLPCPYTGQPMVLKIILTRAEDGQRVTASASATAAPIPTPMPSPAAAQRGPAAPIPIPIPRPAAQRGATPVPLPGVAPPAAPGAPAPIPLPGIGPAPTPIPTPAVVHAPQPGRPAPGPGRPAPSPAPALEPIDNDFEELPAQAPALAAHASAGGLPEVPVVESAPQPPAPAPATASTFSGPMDPRIKGPMALEDFEAGLKMGPSDVAPAPTGPDIKPALKPGSKPRSGVSGRGAPPAAPKPAAADVPELEPIDDDPEAICSIFISRTNKAEVHELVAEIQGITTEEAQRHCQKAVVPIVKNIPVGEADAIRSRFREINVNPRIVVKR
ncbi:MAG: hypothetical protein M5U26_11355 [Planctomycetota bacterium]|nr:hypothetical protein [Planctomycetota bacterium]